MHRKAKTIVLMRIVAKSPVPTTPTLIRNSKRPLWAFGTIQCMVLAICREAGLEICQNPK